ncbi:MAG TPA: arylsulfotransferase family protein [Opitutaceae bacterium]
MTQFSEKAPKYVFILALLLTSFGYGYVAHRKDLFPSSLIRKAEMGFAMLWNRERPWYYIETAHASPTTQPKPGNGQPGLTLIAGIGPKNRHFAAVVDQDGRTINHWDLDWFKLWPESAHLDDEVRPRSPPGPVVHGLQLMEDGGLVFNFEALGMVRVDVRGNVVWRLPLATHHSLERDGNGNFWTSVRRTHKAADPRLPNFQPPFFEYTIVEISPEGRVLREESIVDLLQENGLQGLLYLATYYDETTQIGGDTFHLNDVEPFPAHMTPGFFRPGDVMVSLRRANAVIVFDLPARKVRYVSIGGFLRQHDPDFVDGNSISVFDNNNLGGREQGFQSRVVLEKAPEGERRVAFAGTAERPFYTEIMGKHQWLPNGNLLLVESRGGRVVEVDPDGDIVWEYVNLVEAGVAGLVSEGMRLPETITAEFFDERRRERGSAIAAEPDAGAESPAAAHPATNAPAGDEH